jgi:hypothetical protein
MKKLSRMATAAAIFMFVSASPLLAQSTPNTETPAVAPAPAAPAPTATPQATTTTTDKPTTTTDKDSGTTKKKTGKKMTRQQEIDKSIDSGTVPKRYRSSVPKEYQQYVPFAK